MYNQAAKHFKRLPFVMQNFIISIYNYKQYKLRHGGKYQYYRNYYSQVKGFSEQQLMDEITRKKNSFFNYAKNNSTWYKNVDFESFESIPILTKEDIIEHLEDIQTIDQSKGKLSLTGGTTGASMKVVRTKNDIQERFAILDDFRFEHGYELGKRAAWFSGKNLISDKDIKKGVCSHYDYINKIRFYSTFHINQRNFDVYWESLNKFKPDFIIGFPSSVFEICDIANKKGLILEHKVKVFFPTAETVLPIHREVISKVLGCKLVDQYASSEGAPFILECTSGNLHIHPLTGIFEVVNDEMQPTNEGELLVTSYTTYGTPLIRYRIGDRIKLSPTNKTCECGSIFPLVDRIDGRSNDYILSPSHGKVNLGNISNSTKDVSGIIKFQILQSNLKTVTVLIVANDSFTQSEQAKFVSALSERLGPDLAINIELVQDIPTEKSGKFRIIKNKL